jgi:hypothetical protein
MWPVINEALEAAQGLMGAKQVGQHCCSTVVTLLHSHDTVVTLSLLHCC